MTAVLPLRRLCRQFVNHPSDYEFCIAMYPGKLGTYSGGEQVLRIQVDYGLRITVITDDDESPQPVCCSCGENR